MRVLVVFLAKILYGNNITLSPTTPTIEPFTLTKRLWLDYLSTSIAIESFSQLALGDFSSFLNSL